MNAKVIGFECLILEYPTCWDFGKIYSSLTQNPLTTVEGFTIVDDFLFRDSILCITNTFLHDHLIWKMHVRGIWHFSRDKTIFLVEDRFYSLSVKQDVARVVAYSKSVRLQREEKTTPSYTLLSILLAPWEHLSVNFVLDLPHNLRKQDSILRQWIGFSRWHILSPAARL